MNCSALGRADLLRALAAAGDVAQQVQMAAVLGFERQPNAIQLVASPCVQTATIGSVAITYMPPQKVPPLRAPLFGIVHAQALEPASPAPSEVPQPLTAADYAPRSSTPLRPQPLLPGPAVVRRAQQALAQPTPGRKLDVPRAVQQLAQGQVPRPWPCLLRPAWPEHVILVIDRSQHLRPYFSDQQQLLDVLARCLGPARLSTYTIQGDPFTPLSHWAQGRTQAVPAAIAAPPAGSVLLLLSDQGALHPDAAASASRWSRATAHWARHGARVLACPPCSPALGSAAGAVAFWPVPQGFRKNSSLAQVISAEVAIKTGAKLQQLLTLLSCARRIEPALLRAIRLLDPLLAAEPGLEGLLWSQRQLLDASYALCVWQPGQALAYRQRFARIDPALQQAVLLTMRRIHAVRGQAIEVQETLAWASHVAAATAEPFAAEIAAAQAWLVALAQRKGAASDPALQAFAQQTQAAQAGDTALLGQFPDAFGPLWGLAYAEAQRQGVSLPDANGLPLDRLGEWLPPPDSAGELGRFRLVQEGERLWLKILRLAEAEEAFGLGTSLELSALTVVCSERVKREVANHFDYAFKPFPPDRICEVQRFAAPVADQCALGVLQPGKSFHVRTETMVLTVAEVLCPFDAVERGRDRYGLYADMRIQGEEGEAIQRMRYIEPSIVFDEFSLFENPYGFWITQMPCSVELWFQMIGRHPVSVREGVGNLPATVERAYDDEIRAFLAALAQKIPQGTVSRVTGDVRQMLAHVTPAFHLFDESSVHFMVEEKRASGVPQRPGPTSKKRPQSQISPA